MFGSIIGNIAGSIYKDRRKAEKMLDRNIPLFQESCFYTDETIMTVASADALINEQSFKERFGSYTGFSKEKQNIEGGLSPIAFMEDSFEDVLKNVNAAAMANFNKFKEPENNLIIATVIYLARTGLSKETIKEKLKSYGLIINYDVSEKEKLSNIEKALISFFDSNDFEDAIRKAICLGGDTEKTAAMTGEMAEAYYNIPNNLIKQASEYLPNDYLKVINGFYYTTILKKFMKEEEMDDPEFLKMLRNNQKVFPSETPLEWFGCFPLTDENDIIIGFRLLIPKIVTFENLKVVIHEYTHAFDIYNMIGKKNEYNVNALELEAKTKELKLERTIKNYDL